MGNYDGTVYTRETFKQHIDSIPVSQLKWIKFGAIHNTGAPNMAQQRVTKGGAAQRMKNAKPDADKRLGGKGAHYWCFETGEIGKACPLPTQGAHSAGWNSTSFGIEQVADFRDKIDDPKGAGKPIVDTAAFVFATILKRVGLPANSSTIMMNKENHTAANTTHHDCPGNRFDKADFVRQVQAYMGQVPAVTPVTPEVPKTATLSVTEIQTLLTSKGYNPGPIDGLSGTKTKAAIMAFQTALGLKADGLVGPFTTAKLLDPKVAVAPKPVVVAPATEPTLIKELDPSQFIQDWFKRIEGKGKPGKPFEAYDDRGTIAIGYGHNASSGRPPFPKLGDKITEAEANQILFDDLEAVKAEVIKVLGSTTKLYQHELDGLLLDCYQRGQTQFTKTAAVKAIKDEDMDEARDAMYAQANATKDSGLRNRRLVEAQIFEGLTPSKW